MRFVIVSIVVLSTWAPTVKAAHAQTPPPAAPATQQDITVFDEVCIAKLASDILKAAKFEALQSRGYSNQREEGSFGCTRFGKFQQAFDRANRTNLSRCVEVDEATKEIEAAQGAIALATIRAAREAKCIRTIHAGEAAVVSAKESRRLLEEIRLVIKDMADHLKNIASRD